ncbi:MAG: glycosyltransferase family 9 protein [Bacteroidetes bacterium]|nr:glycosyltransferase family 9 protein [Bacteroidota bacterium]
MKLVLFRRLNKSSLLLYLFFLRAFPSKKIKESRGSILVLADLFFGDLAMAGRLIIKLKKENPTRKIILLCKFSLSDAANLFDVVVIKADYLNWRILGELRKASPEGYGRIINIFSWKWLSLMEALPHGEVISHLGGKSRSNKTIDKIIPISDRPIPASVMMFDLIQSSTKDIENICLNLLKLSRRFNDLHDYLVIHIGTSHHARLWPLDVIRLLFSLAQASNKTIVLTGFKQQDGYQNELDEIIDGYRNKIKIINLMSQTNLRELLEIVSNSKGIISVDTGIIHWARLFLVPNLSVMGQSDHKLFGAQSRFFKLSRSIATAPLDCQDKHTFHGIKINWVNTCARSECPLPTRLCLDGINHQQIEKDFFELFG